jgi:hypothetical protein
MYNQFKQSLRTNTSRIISIIILFFLSTIGFIYTTYNLRSNSRLTEIITSVNSIKNDLHIFTQQYSNDNIPSQDLDTMINHIQQIQYSIKSLESNSNNINTRQKILISSLLDLYQNKMSTLLNIAQEYQKSYAYFIQSQDYKTLINSLNNIEKLTMKYMDNTIGNEFCKNRIAHLQDIYYNLDSIIFKEEAKNSLKEFIKFFATRHIQESNYMDKTILEKENQVINLNI